MSTPSDPAQPQQFQEFFSDVLQGESSPELPDRANLKTVRAAVASALAQAPACEVAEECLRFGLAPLKEGEDPWKSKIRRRGVAGDLKNLIFAANGPKPKIVLLDAVNNDIQITENAEHCLVYNTSAAS